MSSWRDLGVVERERPLRSARSFYHFLVRQLT